MVFMRPSAVPSMIGAMPLRESRPDQFRALTPLPGDGGAWKQLATSEEARDHVNRWLRDPNRLDSRYEFAVRVSHDVADLRAQAKRFARSATSASGARDDGAQADPDDRESDQLGQFLDSLDESTGSFVQLVLRDLRTGEEVNPWDVGTGIAQVLPVLVHAFSHIVTVILVEQPELHLHPAMQAELGDALIWSALGHRELCGAEGRRNDNTWIVETHSEHLILRLLRRIRETTAGRLPAGLPPVRPEDVGVVFVEPARAGRGSTLTELPVTEDGDFARGWPGGFFPERLKELFE
jgi:hypothetical protein